MALGLYIICVHASRQWAGTEDRSYRRNVNDACRLCSRTKTLGALFCKLEDSGPLALMKDVLINFLIIEIDHIRVEVLIIIV